MIPFVGTVVLLQLIVFQRRYTLHFLAQLGGSWDLFATAGTPAEPPAVGDRGI